MSVIAALEALPTDGLTVTALKTLDAVVPGEWSNVTRFDQMVAEICGDAPPKLTAQVVLYAKRLEKTEGARLAQAVQIYQLVDTVDKLAAGAAVASKVTGMFGSLSFLQKFTPKPETTQALDAGLKLIAELLAFGRIHGMPTTSPDDIARFTGALTDYARYDLMRIAAWVVFDGVLPLGPGFVSTIIGTWKGLASDALTSNGVFQQLASQLPGESTADKQAFIVETLDTTGDWVSRFVAEKGITQENTLDRLRGVLSITAGGMDYVAAAIDASTDYFSHTGTQTVARALARMAYDELKAEVWRSYVADLGA